MELFVILLICGGAAFFLIRQHIKTFKEPYSGCSQNCSECKYADKNKPVQLARDEK